jgi:hypothetical protein
MIRKAELEQIREINRKLPFAHPIEPGPSFKDWAESVGIHLFPAQVRMGERLLLGETVMVGRRVGVSLTRNALRWYIEDNTDD